MSDFISFKRFHRTTNLSYQQLLRAFHKARKDKDPLLEGEDYHYEGKDDVRKRTGILFVNPVLLFPKLKKQRVDLVYVKSQEVLDETTVVPDETDMKPPESTQGKENYDTSVSSGSTAVPDETKVKPDDSLHGEIVRALTNQLEAKDKQIENKDEQIGGLTDTINKMEVNRLVLQQELIRANSVIYALKGDVGEGSEGNTGEPEESEPEGNEVTEGVHDTPPSKSPHDGPHDEFTPPEVGTPSSGAEPHAGEDFAGEEVPPT